MSVIKIPSSNIYKDSNANVAPDNKINLVQVNSIVQEKADSENTYSFDIYSFDSSSESDTASIMTANFDYLSNSGDSDVTIINADGTIFDPSIEKGFLDSTAYNIGVDDDSNPYGYDMTLPEKTASGTKYTYYLSNVQGQVYKFHISDSFSTEKYYIRMLVSLYPKYLTALNFGITDISNRSFDMTVTDGTPYDIRNTQSSDFSTKIDSNVFTYNMELATAKSEEDILSNIYDNSNKIRDFIISPKIFEYVGNGEDINSVVLNNSNVTTKAYIVHTKTDGDYIYIFIPYIFRYYTRLEINEERGQQTLSSLSYVTKNVKFTIGENITEHKTESINFGDEFSVNKYNISDNTFINYSLANSVGNKVLSQYKKGRRSITILCDIAKYYNELGEAEIDPTSTSLSSTTHYKHEKYLYKEFAILPWRKTNPPWIYGSNDIFTPNYKYYLSNVPNTNAGYTIEFGVDTKNAIYMPWKNYIAPQSNGDYSVIAYKFYVKRIKIYEEGETSNIRYNLAAKRHSFFSEDNPITGDLETNVSSGEYIYTIPNLESISTSSSTNGFFRNINENESIDDIIDGLTNGTIDDIEDIFNRFGVIKSNGNNCEIAIILPIWTFGYYNDHGVIKSLIRYYETYEMSIHKPITVYEKKFTFTGDEIVIPYQQIGTSASPYYQEVPIFENADGSPTKFDVVKVSLIYTGAVWQQLTLSEHIDDEQTI